jgi:AraC family transcriptional regulator
MAESVRPGEFEGSIQRARHAAAFDIRAVQVEPRGRTLATHTHAEAHFLLVVSGAYRSAAHGAPEVAVAPFLAFAPPGVTHADQFASDAGAFVSVSLEAEAFAASAGGLPDRPLALMHRAALAAAFRIARAVGAGDGALLDSAAWELVGAANDDEDEALALPAWTQLAYAAVMDQAEDAELSVARIAALAGVHPTHLARVFRQAFGCSPGELMRWRRVERTADLLARTRRPAAEIASAVGFADQSHMSRTFKAVYGLTPGAWRRAHDVAPIQDGAPQAA